jgi:hypothetical protein
MTNKKSITTTSKTSNLKNFTPLSRKQLQVIAGGDDPKLSRGTKTSSAD